MRKYIIITSLLFLFILGLIGLFGQPKTASVFIRLDDSVEGKIRPYAEALVDEMNRNNPPLDKPYVLYTARFELQSPIKKLKNYDEKAVLWLGGEKVIDFREMKNYGTVLIASSLSAHLFPKAYYFPIPYVAHNTENRKPQFYALINTPPTIEDILKEKNLPYRLYDTDNLDEIRKDMPLFKACFVQHAGLDKADVNLHPVFLEMASSGVPLIGYRVEAIASNELNVLGDLVLYGRTKDDVLSLVEKIENNTAEISDISEKEKVFVQNILDIRAQAKRLTHILKLRKNLYFNLNADVNIDTFGKAGDYHYGDYWLGHDLGQALENKKISVSYSFLHFPLLYKTGVNLIIRGNFQQINHMDKNIFWLAYPFLVAEDQTLEQYGEYIAGICKNYNAFAVSSQKLYHFLENKCPNLSYIPQFTNTERFYPDYDEKVKSEILFIGNAHYKRKTPEIVYRAGLPISIYGNRWEKGMAKDTYIDNRLLRKYYSSAKIVLNDTLPAMKKYGFINNRVYDVTASGGFLISDYMKEIEEIYGDTIPMWKSEDELIELVRYYLAPEHEQERIDKANRAQDITLKNFTSDIIAEKFKTVINKIR